MPLKALKSQFKAALCGPVSGFQSTVPSEVNKLVLNPDPHGGGYPERLQVTRTTLPLGLWQVDTNIIGDNL